ncbi:FxsA [Pseudooceanicola batsensis HTCC2597]|uniref:FxsA n=1 Tax=Pseudooceanicola batsensis (strain ATCC BAA-863 / DSM 15984 / KCTC 12145 / HTCC2597) TaxID=252305 RepID=A3TXU9_PSEBH|nr:FxsA family protein [Pseudooceanicola batsensis]EAQ02983.1 FxsA [Pseudooceanicola batsensis HTCC2597]
MWLLLAFIAVPMIEIALFIQVGGFIGLGWTLLIVLATALLGTWLVRAQGRLAINNLRRSFSELRDPTEPLADAAMILLAGALLLTPGFFTDAVGFALLTPPIRHAAYLWLRRNVKVQSFSQEGPRQDYRRPHRGEDEVIDGTYHEVEPPKRPTHTPSGWTRH